MNLLISINTNLRNLFKWNIKELFLAILGCFIFCFAINIFVVPNSLYNGGILGLSQLIRSILEYNYNIHFSFDISGLIALFINIPLFVIAYKMISKTFFRRTIICMLFQTIFLTFIPIPNNVIIDDILTSVLIGGILAGIGCGLTLTSSGSGGGTDIIGLLFTMRSKKYSVGKVSTIINILIYTICGILYGIPTMIYSIIYVVVENLVVDQTHKQNICSYAMIFTKEKKDCIIRFIQEEIDRDATYWDATGAFNKTKTYVIYSAMSKYEIERLKRHINELDKDAFLITSEGIGIDGNFRKKLSS